MLHVWLFAAMMAWQPVDGDDDIARYRAIARDLAQVVRENDALWTDDSDRSRTALLLLSVAYFESNFLRSVDTGELRGDHGGSWCLMQIRIGRGKTLEGWTGRDLVTDRQKCFRVGHRRVRESLKACAALPVKYRLGGYVRGRCAPDDRVSAMRMGWADRWWRQHAQELYL